MNSNYQLTLSRESLKFLKKQERTTQQRICNALKGLTLRPPIGDIRPLKGRDNILRLRVGSFRVLFEVDHKEKMIYELIS